jgi:monoamine oxidase
MNNNSSNPDVIVVGAGAAGVGAGLALARLDVPHIILESSQRVGGRAYSDVSSIGHLWDQGCHWFHSADVNVLRFLAEKIGHKFPPSESSGLAQLFSGGKWHRTPIEDYFIWDVMAKIAGAGGDVAVAGLLNPAEELYPLIRHWCQLIYSRDPEEISTGDAGNYSDSGVNLPVEAGYGCLIERMAEKLPVRRNAQVLEIRVGPTNVTVVTTQGSVAAKACVVAVPARVLERGAIFFDPGLPDTVVQAVNDVPMGWYEKVAIAFDGAVFEGFDSSFMDFCDPVGLEAKPVTFEIQPFGRPIAVAHFGGSVARELAALGDASMVDFAVEALVGAFGSGIRRRIVATAATQWSRNSSIGGAYSCAKPGKAHARQAFAAPIHDRVFLAGEHVHQRYMATCHGAYETGLSAGARAAAAAGYAQRETDALWLPS